MRRTIGLYGALMTAVTVLLMPLASEGAETRERGRWTETCKRVDELTGKPSSCGLEYKADGYTATCYIEEQGDDPSSCWVQSRAGKALEGHRLDGTIRWRFGCYGKDTEQVSLQIEGFPDMRTAEEVVNDRINREVYKFGHQAFFQTVREGDTDEVSWQAEGSRWGPRSYDIRRNSKDGPQYTPMVLLTEGRTIKARFLADLLYGSHYSLDREPSPIVEFNFKGMTTAINAARGACDLGVPK